MQTLPLLEEYVLSSVYEPGAEQNIWTHETGRDAMTESIA
jgi:hypothetical protein